MKLFLSYAVENQEIAEEIFLALSGAGHEVFFDRSSLNASDNYDRILRETIETSDGLIFLISPQSVQKGNYTLTELKYARQKWVHPEHHVLPVMVASTGFEIIPAYLKAVTILQPEGNMAAEVTEAILRWEKSRSPSIAEGRNFSQYLIVIISSVFLTILIGNFFSYIYPRVDITIDLASLFLLISVIIVTAFRKIWKLVRQTTRE